MPTRSPLRTPSPLRALANRQTSASSSPYVSLRTSPGSPSQTRAVLSLRPPATCRSRQFSEMLRVPPVNQRAKGAFHSSTRSHLRDQSSVSACSAQKPSGSFRLRSWRARYSAMEPMCAWRAKASGGGKTRASCKMVSMSATRDLLQPQLDGARFGMPLQLRPALQDQHPELHALARARTELAERDGELEHGA